MPVHVGRTRNLAGRLASHTTPKHNKASFAFKRARRHLDQKASYKAANSRASLVLDEVFGPEFIRQVGLIKAMKVQFVEVKDPIAQYLLELYAHMEFGLPLDEFDTH